MILGLYIPGRGIFYKFDAKYKILSLFLLCFLLTTINSILLLSFLTCLVILPYLISLESGISTLYYTFRLIVFWVIIIFIAQFWLGDLKSAAEISLRLICLVLYASLITYTTKITEMLDSISSSTMILKRIGIPAERSCFMLILTIRLIPIFFQIAEDVRNAHRSRGVEYGFINTFRPVLIRILKYADATSDALIARGYESWDEDN